MMSVTFVLLLASIICIILSAVAPPRVPLWIGTLLLAIVVALMVLPK
jgi:hypothetical protein